MIQYSIEELHHLFSSGELDAKAYYDELFKEIDIQQNRLNAFVTITKTKAYQDLEQADFKELLSGIPYVCLLYTSLVYCFSLIQCELQVYKLSRFHLFQ